MMKVGFSPVSFRANDNRLDMQSLSSFIPQQNKNSAEKPLKDETVLSESEKSVPNVSSPKRSWREGTAGIWKFFASTNQLAQGYVKGLFFGVATGMSLLAGSWFFDSLPKAFTKGGPKLSETILHPIKYIGTAGKVIAGLGTVFVMAYHAVKGHLNANQRTADIDHKMKVGHREI